MKGLVAALCRLPAGIWGAGAVPNANPSTDFSELGESDAGRRGRGDGCTFLVFFRGRTRPAAKWKKTVRARIAHRASRQQPGCPELGQTGGSSLAPGGALPCRPMPTPHGSRVLGDAWHLGEVWGGPRGSVAPWAGFMGTGSDVCAPLGIAVASGSLSLWWACAMSLPCGGWLDGDMAQRGPTSGHGGFGDIWCVPSMALQEAEGWIGDTRPVLVIAPQVAEDGFKDTGSVLRSGHGRVWGH